MAQRIDHVASIKKNYAKDEQDALEATLRKLKSMKVLDDKLNSVNIAEEDCIMLFNTYYAYYLRIFNKRRDMPQSVEQILGTIAV